MSEVFARPLPMPKPEPAPAVTVQNVFERWQTLDLAALKAGKRDSYFNTARLHVLKTFGLRAINSISRSEIEDWWVTLRRGKLTKSRLIQIRAVLAGIFRRATISGACESIRRAARRAGRTSPHSAGFRRNRRGGPPRA